MTILLLRKSFTIYIYIYIGGYSLLKKVYSAVQAASTISSSRARSTSRSPGT